MEIVHNTQSIAVIGQHWEFREFVDHMFALMDGEKSISKTHNKTTIIHSENKTVYHCVFAVHNLSGMVFDDFEILMSMETLFEKTEIMRVLPTRLVKNRKTQ